VLVTGVDLLLSTDGGTSYSYPIATASPTAGPNTWTVPAHASADCASKSSPTMPTSNTGERRFGRGLHDLLLRAGTRL